MASLPRATPRSQPPRLKADLRAREGSKRRAVELYRRLAEHDEEDDHLPRAIAVWRVVLRHDPGFSGAHFRLGELYGRQGFRAESRRHYEAAVANFEEQRRPYEASLARRALEATREDAPAPVDPAHQSAGEEDLRRLSPDDEELVAERLPLVAEAERPRPPDTGSATAGDLPLVPVPPILRHHVDAQLAPEDYRARYDLGIAYREMGLVDEAIAELQLASRDPGRLLDCVSPLADCFLEKGLPALAVTWLERGLAAGPPSDDARHALQYELGHALERAGEAKRALETLTELYGEAAGHRDVAARVRRLHERSVRAAPAATAKRGE